MSKKPKKRVLHKHKAKGRGVRTDSKVLHTHPSHPYPHARGRMHLFPPTSRIRDRKGKDFRGGSERRVTNARGTYRERRTGKRRRWD